MRTALATVLVLLIAPASALAGGWATVGLSSMPDGTAPGEPWVVDLTILQHGRSETPLDGLQPMVHVVKADGGGRRSFAAKPTGRPAVYPASVIFESAGTWRYSVEDGFVGYTHRYPPVGIGGAARASTSTGGPDTWLAIVAAALAGLGTAFLVKRHTSRA
ncbi:MAG: hypothetical protein ABWY95_01280 [Thermoleophilaceae bacterium]